MGKLAAKNTLEGQEQAIVLEWRKSLDKTGNSRLFEGDVNAKRFKNPYAYHVNQTAQDVVHYVISTDESLEVPESISDLCRLMALDANPSESFMSFLQLRSIVFSKVKKSDSDISEYMRIAERVDACLLKAMDSYAESREMIMSYRCQELKQKCEAYERLSSRQA